MGEGGKRGRERKKERERERERERETEREREREREREGEGEGEGERKSPPLSHAVHGLACAVHCHSLLCDSIWKTCQILQDCMMLLVGEHVLYQHRRVWVELLHRIKNINQQNREEQGQEMYILVPVSAGTNISPSLCEMRLTDT